MLNCTLCDNEINNGLKRCDECNYKISRNFIIKKLNSNKKIRKATIEKYSITIDDIRENSLVHSNTLKFLKDNTTNINDVSKLISISFTNEFKNLSRILNSALDKIEELEQRIITIEDHSDDEVYSANQENIYSLNKISNHTPHNSVNDLIKNSTSAYNDVYENFFKEFY